MRVFETDEIAPDRPVLIAGPTASGKSALAMEIAGRGGGVIVNADALQVWECWRILSARPSEEEMAAHPHRLFGHRARGDAYSVGHWLREASQVVSEGVRPIFVGGTGLYLTALTEGLADIPPTPPEVREEADAVVLRRGAEVLARDLDAATAGRIDLRNPARVQRAWEVQRATGRGLAEWQDDTPPPLVPLATATAIRLDADRDWLADRIDTRVLAMVDDGVLDEVQDVLSAWDPSAPWAKAIGAPDFVAHLRGEIDLATATLRAQAATRQYAKRQRTWLRARMAGWTACPVP